ncbi:unnamed protein product [Adineta ricciae]|uniref:non-specific serine/threonine protein kinase n=1 Tax=Adineta ricciae TaxID=249248 RepID=A0A814ALM4_ADIRI|nr:unnamed protein product [Adineta ricciae]CAF1119884.1 unnamed protein product [Adineta ricciae]
MVENSEPVIYNNRYRLQRKLGEENFHTTYLVTDVEADNELKVLQIIPLNGTLHEHTPEIIDRAKRLVDLNNKHIVKYHETFTEQNHLYIVAEYCEDGNMEQYLNTQTEAMIEDEVIEWLIQILTAVNYMHKSNMFHRNLKLKNLFLKSNIIKVGNFDITSISYPSIDVASTFTEFPYFLAPEVLNNNVFLATSDIWAIGCLLYEMCTFQHNILGKFVMNIMTNVLCNGGKRFYLPKVYSKELNDLFTKMLADDPLKRPSAEKLLYSRLLSTHQNNTNRSDQQNKLTNAMNSIVTNQSSCEDNSSTRQKTWSNSKRILPAIPRAIKQIDTVHDSEQYKEDKSSESTDIRMKIDGLRKKAIDLLGESKFEEVYNYLMQQRIVQRNDPQLDYVTIYRGLAALAVRPRDCHFVDALVFLEATLNEI